MRTRLSQLKNQPVAVMIGIGGNFISSCVVDVAIWLNTIVTIVAHSNISMPSARIKWPWACLVSTSSSQNGTSELGG